VKAVGRCDRSCRCGVSWCRLPDVAVMADVGLSSRQCPHRTIICGRSSYGRRGTGFSGDLVLVYLGLYIAYIPTRDFKVLYAATGSRWAAVALFAYEGKVNTVIFTSHKLPWLKVFRVWKGRLFPSQHTIRQWRYASVTFCIETHLTLTWQRWNSKSCSFFS